MCRSLEALVPKWVFKMWRRLMFQPGLFSWYIRMISLYNKEFDTKSRPELCGRFLMCCVTPFYVHCKKQPCRFRTSLGAQNPFWRIQPRPGFHILFSLFCPLEPLLGNSLDLPQVPPWSTENEVFVRIQTPRETTCTKGSEVLWCSGARRESFKFSSVLLRGFHDTKMSHCFLSFHFLVVFCLCSCLRFLLRLFVAFIVLTWEVCVHAEYIYPKGSHCESVQMMIQSPMNPVWRTAQFDPCFEIISPAAANRGFLLWQRLTPFRKQTADGEPCHEIPSAVSTLGNEHFCFCKFWSLNVQQNGQCVLSKFVHQTQGLYLGLRSGSFDAKCCEFLSVEFMHACAHVCRAVCCLRRQLFTCNCVYSAFSEMRWPFVSISQTCAWIPTCQNDSPAVTFDTLPPLSFQMDISPSFTRVLTSAEDIWMQNDDWDWNWGEWIRKRQGDCCAKYVECLGDKRATTGYGTNGNSHTRDGIQLEKLTLPIGFLKMWLKE